MRIDLTDITLVVDRSGSMATIRDDAVGGINSLIEEQAAAPGEANLTLVQFDTEYEFVHRAVPIADVPPYELHPRGTTALLDAIGRAISETKERLSKLADDDRPGLVLFVVMTDGCENASVEYSKKQVQDLIENQEAKHEWKFMFLAADPKSFDYATHVGFQADGVVFVADHQVGQAYQLTSNKMVDMRRQRRRGKKVQVKYSDEERRNLGADSDSA